MDTCFMSYTKQIRKNCMRCYLYILFLLLGTSASPLMGFDKVVIWGHKLHTHTHSYVHNGFYLAFQSLGYPTYWFDNNDPIGNFDFSNTLFLTEGQVDQNIPIRSDCLYVLHNCAWDKYRTVNKMNIQVFVDAVMNLNAIKVEPCIYYDLPGICLYMPWATDLLPEEIDQIKKKLPDIQKQKAVYWVGTIGDGHFGNKNQIQPFISACTENGVGVIHWNPWAQGLPVKDHIERISASYMAPAIVGQWQKDQGYIPCRIFKNISYGQMGVTNSYRVYELFEKKIVYNPDTYQLFYDAKKRIENLTLDEMYSLMDFVKAKHTYINRIHHILSFFERLGLYQRTEKAPNKE